jgi:4-hydroxy-tetrahydrodipicolinate reductase
MGALATRLMSEKGVEIIGAIARSPAKVGQDLGEYAGLGYKLGVPIESDAERVLQRRPDIVVHATQSFLPEIADQLALCVRHGANVVTISEESLYPWTTSPAIAAELDALAKQHGVTITGSGHQDVFWLNMVSNLTGASHRIDRVQGRTTWNADEFGADIIQSKHVGETLEQFEKATASADRPPTFGRNLLGALAHAMGLSPRSWTSDISPVVAETDTVSKSIGVTFTPGTVLGYSDIDTLTTVEGVEFRFEMAGYIYSPGETDINEWSITGEPDLTLSNGVVPSYTTTCTQWVNRIPDVINAVPGFVTVDRLPALRYRPLAFHHYVDAGRLA